MRVIVFFSLLSILILLGYGAYNMFCNQDTLKKIKQKSCDIIPGKVYDLDFVGPLRTCDRYKYEVVDDGN